MMLPPLTFRENVVIVPHPSMYVTDLSASKEAFLSHVTTKCLINSYTSLDKPSLMPVYATNTSSPRAAADQKGGYRRGVTDWRQEVTYRSGAWERQTSTIIDVNLGNDVVETERFEPLYKLLARWDKIKKYKNGKHCHEQRNFFLRLLFLLVSF